MIKRFFVLLIANMALLVWAPVAANAAAVYVRVAPPRPVVERVVRAPGPGYVWVSGFYRWNGRAYTWMPGRWAYPPRAATVWVAPRWEYVPARRSYVFVAGFWR